MRKPRLFTPGPTSVPDQVMLAAAQPMIHHRSPEFKTIMQRVNRNLQSIFCTEQPVLTLAASGTGAAEAALTNLFSPGEKGIIVNNGRFAARWGVMMQRFGMQVVEIPVDWGKAVTEEQLRATMHQHPDAHCVWLVHSETSTGVWTDVQQASAIIHEYSSALVCVDAVSSIGALECRMDEWQLDAVITASQKALMTPPGLSFIAMSERAWGRSMSSTMPICYFDLHKARKEWEQDTMPWTPAVSLVLGLDAALQMILEEGLENVWKRHELMATALWSGLEAVRLLLFGTPGSFAHTCARLPKAGEEFRSELRRRHHITTAAGQDHLKGIIFRIAHMGWYDEGDILTLLSAIEQTLQTVHHSFEPGAGVQAAQKAILAWNQK